MNPSPRSPGDVLKDAAYEQMRDAMSRNFWPSAEEVVVKHKSSGTFWRAAFMVRNDDSDVDMPATWTEVRPVSVTVVKYESVSRGKFVEHPLDKNVDVDRKAEQAEQERQHRLFYRGAAQVLLAESADTKSKMVEDVADALYRAHQRGSEVARTGNT